MKQSLQVHFPLLILAILGLLGVITLSLWFPLIPAYKQAPLADIRTFTPSATAGLAYGVLLCGLYALYGLAVRFVWQKQRPLPLLALITITLLIALPLLKTYPINANDIYRYVIRGHISSIYGANPYLAPPTAFPEDPLLPLAGEWADFTSPYGPLWELTAAALTKISRGDLLMGMLMFKLLALAAHIGSALLLWHSVPFLMQTNVEGQAQASAHITNRTATSRTMITMLWALNPALLLIFVVDGHNDALMIFWLLLGTVIWQRGKLALGMIIMGLGVLTKPIALLALPLFFLATWKQYPDRNGRIRLAATTILGGLFLTWLLFLPYGSPLILGQRLITEASAGGGFSPLVFILFLGRAVNINLSISLLSRWATIAFILFFAWLLWRTWYGRSPLRATADAFIGYIIQALNFRIWYAAWPFPWLLLDSVTNQQPDKWAAYRLRVGLWFLLTAQLSVLIYGHLRVYALNHDHPLAHLIGIPFTFFLPLILAWFPWPISFCDLPESHYS